MTPVARVSGRALTALLPTLSDQPGPVYAALADSVTVLVLDGRVATGARLPSERELAGALHVSRATVTAAYDTLRHRGFLSSRSGSGSYVTVPRQAQPSQGLSRWRTTGPDDVIDLSCATVCAPHARLARAATRALDLLPAYMADDGYEPAGLPVLRRAVAERFERRGVPTTPDQIMITSGALHGVDLLMRMLIGPGDRVLTELPSYPAALDAARAHGARLIPVPMAPGGGWPVEQLSATLRQTSPRLAYLMPDFHNPTGALIGAEARRAVFAAARRTGTTVVVDEAFADLGFGAREPASAALDPAVVTVGSLSKPVWAGLRIGWIRGSAELVNRLAALRASIDMGSAVLDQLIAAELMPEIEDIAAARVAELRPRRDALVAALAARLPQWRTCVPQGGISLWLELDAPLSTPLTLAAAPAGVVIVPGSRFGVDGTLERFLRLPFAAPVSQLETAVDRLAGVWDQVRRVGTGSRPRVVA